MAEDVIVVESNAQVAVTNVHGKRVVVTGTAAIARPLIAASLAALPERRLRVLDREATEEEIQASAARGLVGETSPETGDDGDDTETRPLDQLLKADLEAGAELLGLDAGGNKDAILARIVGEADRLGVPLGGDDGLAEIQTIHAAQGGKE